MRYCSDRRVLRGALSAGWLSLGAGQGWAQCGSPALYEFGGEPGPVCAATTGSQVIYEAVARGRFVSIESSPLLSGSPAAFGRVALDHPAQFMHSEIVGRVWATDGETVYGLDTSNPSNPRILGRITPPGFGFIERLRVHGNFVYALDAVKMFVIDVSNPALPVVRSTFEIQGLGTMNDVEVVGSYAYVSISEGPPQTNSLMVVNIGNPQQPAEVGRVGHGGRWGQRVSKAPNLGGLYALSDNGFSGAIELWSLANAAAPSLSNINTTLGGNGSSSDDFVATNGAICHFEYVSGSLRLFNPSTLIQTGLTISFPGGDHARRMGVDSPFAFITRSTGELARVNITATPPVVMNPYFDVAPGYTKKVLTLNEGFSVLSGFNDLWFFSTPTVGAPSCFAHLKPTRGSGSSGSTWRC